MLLQFRRSPTPGRLLQSHLADYVLSRAVIPGSLFFKPGATSTGRHVKTRCNSTSASYSLRRAASNDLVDADVYAIEPSTTDDDPWWNSDAEQTGSKGVEPLSFCGLLQQATGNYSPRRLRTIASVLYPDTNRRGALPVFTTNPDAEAPSDLLTDYAIPLSDYKLSELPRQILAAQILSLYVRRRLVSRADWAQCLFRLAIGIYRAMETISRSIDASFYLDCYRLYAQMLDLLELWNIFFHVFEWRGTWKEVTLRRVIDSAANNLPPNSNYQDRLLAFVPKWGLASDESSDQILVFSSIVTLALIVEIRYKLLCGLPSTVFAGRAAAAGGSFLNLRNVSPPEATFLHIVGQAARSAPLNRIQFRVALSQLGFTSDESAKLVTTVEHLHSHSEYLIDEAQRCLRNIETRIKTERSANDQPDFYIKPGLETSISIENASISHLRNISMTPPAFLYWIENAEMDELNIFRETFQVAANSAIIAHGTHMLDALIRRTVVLVQRSFELCLSSQMSRMTGKLQSFLDSWYQISSHGPSEELVKTILDVYKNSGGPLSKYASVWASMQRFRSPGSKLWDSLIAHAKSWMVELMTRGEYTQVTSLHQEIVLALEKQFRRSPEAWPTRPALDLTHECLSLCTTSPFLNFEEKMAMARQFRENLVKNRVEPDQLVYRLMMRLSIQGESQRDFDYAISRYTMLSASREDLHVESVLMLRKRVHTLGVHPGTPMKHIMSIISQSIRVWHADRDLYRPYLEGPMQKLSTESWPGFVRAHSYLLSELQKMKDIPEQLKIAACIHKHLGHCVPLARLPPELLSDVEKMVDQITHEFWETQSYDQIRFLGQHLYSAEPEYVYGDLPVVKQQDLISKWLASTLNRKGLTYSLESIGEQQPSLEAHINCVLSNKQFWKEDETKGQLGLLLQIIHKIEKGDLKTSTTRWVKLEPNRGLGTSRQERLGRNQRGKGRNHAAREKRDLDKSAIRWVTLRLDHALARSRKEQLKRIQTTHNTAVREKASIRAAGRLVGGKFYFPDSQRSRSKPTTSTLLFEGKRRKQ